MSIAGHWSSIFRKNSETIIIIIIQYNLLWYTRPYNRNKQWYERKHRSSYFTVSKMRSRSSCCKITYAFLILYCGCLSLLGSKPLRLIIYDCFSNNTLHLAGLTQFIARHKFFVLSYIDTQNSLQSFKQLLTTIQFS